MKDAAAHTAPLSVGYRTGRQGRAKEWQEHLPKAWRGEVVAPVWFRTYNDYEITSQRIVGYQFEEQPCYCEHFFSLTELRSDDDEEFYVEPGYSEHLVAWQMRDGRWLVYRRIWHGEDRNEGGSEAGSAQQAFFSFAQAMPR
jgi:hypothetical protein